MRRIAVILSVPVLAAIALAGCGSAGSSASSDANAAVTATGSFGAAPAIKIPARKADAKLRVKTLIQGTGPTLTSSDSFVGNYAFYVWSGTTHKLGQSTFATKTPALFPSQLLPGLKTALDGKKMGSRVLAVIPPKEAFGTSGNAQAGIKGTDTLVFVVDLIKKFPATETATGTHLSDGGGALPTVAATTPGAAPKVTIPSGKKAPASLITKVLIKGSGPKVIAGQTLVVQYVGVIWRTGKPFDASWTRKQPFSFKIAANPSQVIPGWDKGLVGQTVGSRVMLVVPPAEGYGKSGVAQAGINGTDTLVFVVDILGAFNS